MFGIERVGDAQDAGELVDDETILSIERDVRQMTALRETAPVITGDVRDDGDFLVRESEDLRCSQDVVRVLNARNASREIVPSSAAST